MKFTPLSQTHKRYFHSSAIPPLRLSNPAKTILKQIQSGILRRSQDPGFQLLSYHCRDTEDMEHIPEPIHSEIEQLQEHREYVLQIGERQVHLFWRSRRLSEASRKRVLARIEQWFRFILPLSPTDCAKVLNLHLFFTDHQKHLVPGVVLDSVHANTAFTWSCLPENDIYVYRREEWLKVLIHESFHCLGLDFSGMDSSSADRRILSLFPALKRETDVRLYETYCEMWAEIINLLFFSKRRHRSTVRNGAYHSLLQYERVYSVFQAKKVLRHAGITYADLFVKKEVYQEKTSAFSYYVLKSALMWNVNRFLEWCLVSNEGLVFRREKMDDYVNLVEECCMDTGFQAAFRYTWSDVPVSLRRTMRMSLVEWK